MRISSTKNPAVGFFRSLDRAPVRREHGLYLAEGVRLVREAYETGQTVALALYDPAALERSATGSFLLERLPDWADEAYEADARVLSAAARTETPSGILVAIRHHEPPWLASHAGQRFGVVLDGVVDPGNAGTILRTANAVGVDYVVATDGSVDLFAPKVVRAGMGAHFRLPLHVRVPWPTLSSTLGGVALVALDARGAAPMYTFQWPQRLALIVGSEAHGLSQQAQRHATHRIHIPMRAGVESLNASVAASVVMYHVLGPALSTGD